MRVVLIATVVPFLLAAPALAQGTSESDEGVQIVCKYQAKTGTRFAKKTCRTKAEWEALYQKSRRDAEDNLNKPTIDITRPRPGEG